MNDQLTQRESESLRHDAILAQIPDAIIFADRDGVIRLWNRGAEVLFGFAAAEVIGTSLDVIIPERFRQAHWDGFRRAVASGRTRQGNSVRTTRAVHKSGHTLYVDLSFGLVTDDSGSVIGSVAVGRDGTARHAADKTLRERLAQREVSMSSALPGYSAPTAGFEVPLEMLSACHRRIAQQCSTLVRLLPHLAAHGSDSEARLAAASLIRYFETAAKDHHADEEDDLFPALMESMAGSDAVCLRTLTQGLAAEHRELEARWRHLRFVLEQVVANQSSLLTTSDVEAFVGLYECHMEREERELLPMAARLLSGVELDRIGRAMRKRRGIGLEP